MYTMLVRNVPAAKKKSMPTFFYFSTYYEN